MHYNDKEQPEGDRMTLWLSTGLIFTFAAIALILYRWWDMQCIGVTPVRTLTFIAILFTSGLDVGLIMFPLTEFGGYGNVSENPEYAFANPLAIEFGFWAFLIWGFYFLTCFYFAIIEPRVKFFEIPMVKLVNNVVIIGTCAFTAYLLLVNLPWYLPQLGDGESVVPAFYIIVFLSIALAVYSSSKVKYIRILSVGSSVLFITLIAGMWFRAFVMGKGSPADFFGTAGMLGEYFANIHHFVLPINDYHEFYLFWWFAWSIMIGQFVSRFVSGFTAWQLLLLLLIVPSIPIALWFSVLYWYFGNDISIAGLMSWAMMGVGILFVLNSLDSLTRLYTTNIGLTVEALGTGRYVAVNWAILFALVMAFQFTPFKIEWVGLVVVGIYAAIYTLVFLRRAALRLVPA